MYYKYLYIKLGIGDWGLGIGDWGLGIGPNPQSPIPNPQIFILKINKLILKYLFIPYTNYILYILI